MNIQFIQDKDLPLFKELFQNELVFERLKLNLYQHFIKLSISSQDVYTYNLIHQKLSLK